MTLLQDAIYDLLDNDATLTSRIGSRIYPMVAPQDETYPYIVYQTISDQTSEVVEGASGTANGRVQIASWALTYREAHQLDEEVRAAVQGYRGTNAGVFIASILPGSGRDTMQMFGDGRERAVFGVQRDLSVWYDEST